MSAYNATVIRFDADTGENIGIFVAEVNEAGLMLRSNAVQCTGLEGSPNYDAYIRKALGGEFNILRDDCRAYRRRLLRMGLPRPYHPSA